MVQISELQFARSDGRVILDNLRLRVNHGEVLFIVGPPSSGKSLLLKLLYRDLKPTSGQILVGDRNVSRISADKVFQLRRQIGIIPQNPPPLRRSVYENLIFKLRVSGFSRKEAARKALETLEMTDLVRIKDLTPNELTPVDQKASYIAMAISNDPTLLLCDEPFSGLKGEEREEVLDFLRKVHNKKRITIIVTTQHPQMARLFGEEARMVRLENGRLQEESKPKPKPKPKEEKNDSLSM